MEDMNDVHDEIMKSFAEFRKLSPDELKEFADFLNLIESPGKLDSKQKELIALGIGITSHCRWCIAYHVKKAIDAGATKEELIEAAWVAVLMGGGPALMYAQYVLKCIKDYGL